MGIWPWVSGRHPEPIARGQSLCIGRPSVLINVVRSSEKHLGFDPVFNSSAISKECSGAPAVAMTSNEAGEGARSQKGRCWASS